MTLRVHSDAMVHFCVIDQGPGVAATEKPNLFKIFKRRATSAMQDGFGIGLALAHQVAVAHGGTLSYADGTVRGAEFTLSIPLHVHVTERQT